MFKGLIRSIKKPKKSESKIFLDRDSDSKDNLNYHLNENNIPKYTYSEEEYRPTPLLKWSASLDDLLKLCNQKFASDPNEAINIDSDNLCTPVQNSKSIPYNRPLTDIKQQKIINDKGNRRSLNIMFKDHDLQKHNAQIFDDLLESDNNNEIVYLESNSNLNEENFVQPNFTKNNFRNTSISQAPNLSSISASPEGYLPTALLNDSSCTYVSYFHNQQNSNNSYTPQQKLSKLQLTDDLEEFKESISPTSLAIKTDETNVDKYKLCEMIKQSSHTSSLSPSANSTLSQANCSDDEDSGAKLSSNISENSKQLQDFLLSKEQHISYLENMIKSLETKIANQEKTSSNSSLYETISKIGIDSCEMVCLSIPSNDFENGRFQFMLGRNIDDIISVKRVEAGNILKRGDRFIEINGEKCLNDVEAGILEKLRLGSKDGDVKCVVLRDGIKDDLLSAKEDLSLALLELEEIQEWKTRAEGKIKTLNSDIIKLAEWFDRIYTSINDGELNSEAEYCIEGLRDAFGTIFNDHIDENFEDTADGSLSSNCYDDSK